MHDGFSERLRQVRKHFGLTAAQMAERVGLNDRKSWENYERGQSSPKADVLSRLTEAGIDPTWLLTGSGTMLQGATATATAGGIDRDLLARVHKGVAEVYRSENARISADPLADEVARIYDDLVATYDSAEKRVVGLELALHQLRRQLRSPPLAGAANSKQAS